ncbi:MAG: hypothetical protein JWQ81_2945 [Amycolatopsis sp.]|uniref:hypothetical protein n=1 Tax=Amycolatopsis sp. TaxID=37632 RepID=UPI00260F2E9B|nr:hypothetical protein [Amycolatopsis sp.]MCU1682206.1 hypothetical protein [Amycolatopsis sp.]
MAVPDGTGLPEFCRGLCDDAAVFPPGLAPLPDAVSHHLRYRGSPFAELVGPLILPVSALGELSGHLESGHLDPVHLNSRHLESGHLDVTITAPAGPATLPAAFAAAGELLVTLHGVEVAMPSEMSPAEFFTTLESACAGREPETVFVEIPRDDRRPESIAHCARGGYRAKFRTGGVKAELYPDETELASAIRAVVDAGVPFKATAGLHHAIRNTDPETGFEQHGFLNLLLATEAAAAGAGADQVWALLAERDPDVIAAGVSAVDGPAVRGLFRSFGTCSVLEPLAELIELGLVPSTMLGAAE